MRILGLCMWGWALLGALPRPHGSYSFRTFGFEEGLSSTSITAVAVDHENTVWVGSEDGLFMFKGRRFIHLGKAEGLADPWVYGLITPASGGLWVHTQSALQFWDGVRFRGAEQMGLPPSKGAVNVFGLEQQNLLYLLDDRIILVGQGPVPQLLEGMSSRDVLAVCRAGTGPGLWFLTTKGMVRWQAGRPGAPRAVPAALRRHGRVVEMLQGPEGAFFIRTYAALLRLSADCQQVEVLAQGLDRPHGNGILRLDAQGRVWTKGIGGLLVWAQGETTFLGERQGLQTESPIFGFALDQEGGLWVGSDRIHHMRGRGVAEVHNRPHGLPYPFVQGAIRDRSGVLWAYTRGGMARADGHGWMPVEELSGLPILTSLELPDGQILFGGESGGKAEPTLWSVQPGVREPRPVPLQGLSTPPDIHALAGDARHLWMATKNDGLLWGRREGRGWRMQSVPVPGWHPPGTVAPQVTGVLVDRMGGLWVCGEAGLARWDGRVWRSFGKADGVPEAGYFTMKEAPDGRIWVSALRDRQLIVLTARGGDWGVSERYEQAHPLARDPIYAIGFEPDGSPVLGTGRGVKLWKQGQLRWFASEWGLGAADCSQNALFRDWNGDWWVGTASGLVHLDATQIPAQQPVSGVRILEVLGKDGQRLPMPPSGERLHLPSPKSAFTVSFMPVSLLGSAGCTMEYRMLGLEEDWKPEDGLEIGFGGLPPGTYTYQVRLRRWDDALGPMAELRIEVPTPWYGRWWFRALAVLGLAYGVHLLFRWRTRRLKAANRRLETEVTARTWELETQARELSVANGELRALNDQLVEAMGEIRTLRGFIPICSYCKKIRDDSGYWDQLEQYLGNHTDAKLSHGVCPDCATTLRKEWGLS